MPFPACLKIFILKKLEQGPKTGYQLMKIFQEVTGRKPSPGSVYPALKELKDNGYVKVLEQDGRKIYSLTGKGRKLVEKIDSERSEVYRKMSELLAVIREALGDDFSFRDLRMELVRLHQAVWEAERRGIPPENIIESIRKARVEIEGLGG